jgi:hypothetical protein
MIPTVLGIIERSLACQGLAARTSDEGLKLDLALMPACTSVGRTTGSIVCGATFIASACTAMVLLTQGLRIKLWTRDHP